MVERSRSGIEFGHHVLAACLVDNEDVGTFAAGQGVAAFGPSSMLWPAPASRRSLPRPPFSESAIAPPLSRSLPSPPSTQSNRLRPKACRRPHRPG